MQSQYEYFKQIFQGLHNFILLWATQGLSTLGSSMTSYALIIWAYEQEGSALTTALLSVSSYAPYVLLSIFAGALSDRWDKKRTMLVCDTLAALSTIAVLMLLLSGNLRIWLSLFTYQIQRPKDRNRIYPSENPHVRDWPIYGPTGVSST